MNKIEEKDEVKIEIKNEVKKSKLEIASLVKNIIITAFIGMNIFTLADMFFKFFTFHGYNAHIPTLFFTIFFGAIIYSLLLAIFKKASKATLVSFIFIFVLSLVNQVKILYTGEPIYFSDITFIGSSGDLLELATNNISFKSVLTIVIGFGIYAAIMALIIFISHKNNIEIKNIKARIAIIVIDLVILLLLFFPNSHTKEFYLKLFFNIDKYEDFNSYTTSLEYYARNNLINGMYGTYLNNIFTEPDDYDENKLDEFLNDIGENYNDKFGKPNIIVIFSEAFWDIDQLEEIQFDKKITSNFNNLKSKGKFVNLISPTYGGMSENVAFELFTGGSMNYFPRGYIPIMSLYSRSNSTEIPSLPKVLSNNGYYPKIVFGKDYYNSENAYLKMGFSEYIELNRDKDYKYITDEYCVDLIIKDFEEKEDNQPFFYVLSTIESHMPYYSEKYYDYDITITTSNLSNEMNETILAYSQGIYNSDKELGRLYEYVNNYGEPTILVFLGDHLPYLYTSNSENVIDNLEYFNTDDILLNEYRKYNTQALILANYDIENMDIAEYSGVDLLLTSIVNQLDIENDKYYNWLDTTKEDLPASNARISLDRNGKIYFTNEITGKMKGTYKLKELMQYKFFVKY